jgi:hypothetical protein
MKNVTIVGKDRLVLQYNADIPLQQSVKLMEEVVVTASIETRRVSHIVGELFISGQTIVCRKDTVTAVKQLANKLLQPFAAKKTFALYPNPVVRGSAAQISFNAAKAGLHRIELAGMNGVVVWLKEMNLQAGRFTGDVRIEDGLAAGVYVVRVFGEANQLLHSGKLIVR